MAQLSRYEREQAQAASHAISHISLRPGRGRVVEMGLSGGGLMRAMAGGIRPLEMLADQLAQPRKGKLSYRERQRRGRAAREGRRPR